MHRRANQETRAHNPPRVHRSKRALLELDACPTRNGHIQPVIDENPGGRAVRGLEATPHQARQVARVKVGLANLHVFDPGPRRRGDLFEQALRSTAWEGRVLVIGFASGEIPKAPMNLPLLKGCSIVGVSLGGFRKRYPRDHAANFDQLFAWHAEGRLKPLVSRTLPMSKAAEALTMLANRSAVGKIVLTMGRPA